MGVSALKYGTPGDGVPATTLTPLPLPVKDTVQFSFADPKEVKIETEGRTAPYYSFFVKDTTDYIETAFTSPDNALVAVLAGGTVDTTDNNDEWLEPTSVPDINLTFVVETEVHQGKKVRYTITNARVAAKFSQAPGAEKSELLLVRWYKQAATTAAGVAKPAFLRKVITV